jgi:hypothetical protein
MRLLLVVSLALIGCGMDARVLSQDGSKRLATCTGATDWAQCVSRNCPNGFDVVIPLSWDPDGLVKCK